MQPVTFVLMLFLSLLGSGAGCSTNVTVVSTTTKVVTSSVDTTIFKYVNSTLISTTYTCTGVSKSGNSLNSSSIRLTSTQTVTDPVTITQVPTITCTVGHECPTTAVAAVVSPTLSNVSDTTADTSSISGTTTVKVMILTSTRTSTVTYTLKKETSAAPAPIVSTSIANGTTEFAASFASYLTQISATSTVMRGPPFPKLNATAPAAANFTYLAAAKQAIDNSSSVLLISGSAAFTVYSPPPLPDVPLTDSSTTITTVIPPPVSSDSATTESTSTVVITPTITQTTINTSTGTSTITQLVVATASSGVQGKVKPARHFVFLAAFAKVISKAVAESIDASTWSHYDARPCTNSSVDPGAGYSSFHYTPTISVIEKPRSVDCASSDSGCMSNSGDRMGSYPTKALFAMVKKYVKARAVADEAAQTTVTVTRHLLRGNYTLTSTVYNATTTVYNSTCAKFNTTTSTLLDTTGSVFSAPPYPYGIVAPPANSTPITMTPPPATEPTATVTSRAALVSVSYLLALVMAVMAI